jgi:hypothetical protein
MTLMVIRNSLYSIYAYFQIYWLSRFRTRLWGWTIEGLGLVSERGQIFVFFPHDVVAVSGVTQPPVQ